MLGPSTLVLLITAGSAPAAAAGEYQSETNDVEIYDRVDLFTTSEISSGWLPSSDSIIAVKFAVEASGGAEVQMEGAADLWWPDGLNLNIVGEEATGWILVDSALEAVTSIRFDIDIYSYEAEIDRRGVSVDGEAEFDPFLLDGGSPDSVTVDSAGQADELIEFSVDVFSGVSLVFTADIQPQAETTMMGLAWMVEDDRIETAGESLEIIPTGAGTEELEANLLAQFDSTMDLTFIPALSVEVLGSDYELASFELPVELSDESFEHMFPDVDLAFPIPLLSTSVNTHDFGEVELGNLANLELDVANLGDLDLEGTVEVIGSTYFSVYPNYFLAGSEQEDGTVVTFAPQSAGEFEATLFIQSNDPNAPELELIITGIGIDPDAVADDGDGADGEMQTIPAEVGCGCATASDDASARGGAALVGMFALLLVRRRRRSG